MRPPRQMWERQEGKAKQGTPTQRPEREQGDSDQGQTKGRQGGALKSGSWGAFGGSKEGETPRDLGGPRV